jgi:hypothetical protein
LRDGFPLRYKPLVFRALCEEGALKIVRYSYIAAILFSFFGCSTYSKNPGVIYHKSAPSLFLSVAPAHANPREIEINDGILSCYIYSGLGGYSWGARKRVFEMELDQKEVSDIASLAIAAMKDAPVSEEIAFHEGATWYLQTYYPYFRVITSSSPDIDAEERGYLNLLKLYAILEGRCKYKGIT